MAMVTVIGTQWGDEGKGKVVDLLAQQAQAHGAKMAMPLLVTPGSEMVRATIERDGQLEALQAVNATVLATASASSTPTMRTDRFVPSASRSVTVAPNRTSSRSTWAGSTT